jgi:hypothetical protein
MDMTPEFVLALVEDGTLEARGRSLVSLQVRPALVSVLRVVGPGDPESRDASDPSCPLSR